MKLFNQNKFRIGCFLLCIVILITSCSKEILAPKPNADLTTDDLWINAAFGGGLLGKAYANLNYGIDFFLDTYTDNAVPISPESNALALGNWTVENNPIGSWNNSYNSIKYLNIFLQNAQDLPFQIGTPSRDSLERKNRIGEAYYLRAWYQWQLLRDYAGYAEGNEECLGFPIITFVAEADEDLINLPRNTYTECVNQILSDLDSAANLLPLEYAGSDDIIGVGGRGRGSKLSSLALKALVCLYAASPAYGSSSTALWQRAAQAAHDAIEASGGLTDLTAYGQFNDYNNYDHIWIQPPYSGNDLERQFYPPSLRGSGSINPSQNLVDAFPAVDGYPISESISYDSETPYINRDPRFYRFIFFNGDIYNSTTIRTFQGGSDASGGLLQQGTRTGYYLKKFLSTNVSLDPGNETTDQKFKTFLSRTRLYLNFAEAANEAYGPDGGDLGYSAAEVMQRIRKRAGIDSDPTATGYQDSYLEDQVLTGKNAFRTLIHSERRIELCFEGDRFWDLRRWNEELNHTVKGTLITQGNNGFDFQERTVEEHRFQPYMRYIPIPFKETLIMESLEQNQGWK